MCTRSKSGRIIPCKSCSAKKISGVGKGRKRKQKTSYKELAVAAITFGSLVWVGSMY